MPNKTADSPIKEPTERSIPPLDDHGSQRDREQADLDAEAEHLEGIAQGEEIGAGRGEDGDLGRDQRQEDRLRTAPAGLKPRDSGEAIAMSLPPSRQAVRRDGEEDDRPLDGLLPLRARCGGRQERGVDRPEEQDADQGADHRPPAARDRRTPPTTTAAITCISKPGARSWGRPPGTGPTFSKRIKARQRTHHDEDREDDALRPDTRQPGRLGVRAGRVDGPSRRQIPSFDQANARNTDHRDPDHQPLPHRLAQRRTTGSQPGRFRTNSPSRR